MALYWYLTEDTRLTQQQMLIFEMCEALLCGICALKMLPSVTHTWKELQD